MPVIFFGRPRATAGVLGLNSLLTSFYEHMCLIFRFKMTSSGYARPLQRQRSWAEDLLQQEVLNG